MSLLLTFVIILLCSILGKFLFKSWFNHLTIYSLIFGGSLFLYELKFLPYYDLNSYTWFIIIVSFIAFLMGIMTIISARNLSKENPLQIDKSVVAPKIFSDDGKILKYIIIALSVISMYSAIEFWMILIKQFGSIPGVLLNGEVIYRMNVLGEIKGNTPYLHLFGFVAIFLSGIYTAYRRKFTILTFIPVLSIVLREIAGAGRAGMLFALTMFAFSFLLYKNLLDTDIHNRYAFKKSSAVIGIIILIIVFVGGATLVKFTRFTNEASPTYSGASKELRSNKGSIIISPSMYLYLSSDVGVLSKYLSSDGENTGFGQNTFLTVYNFLGKFNVIEKQSEYQKGYYIPMWTNTGTYLRELHADFGVSGVLIGPYLLGLLLTWLWFKFLERKNLIVFAILVNLNIIVALSFFVMATRILYWSTSLVLILICIPLLEKLAVMKSYKKSISVETV